ncbi:cytochrome P450 [Westerdykella ornata]|uniref:Cytochrome P450 n=1 Tax=Westerdykella ornata TaxID=318751 RepID=A0A6A6JYD8_WESOR|nr:cytochrome P450 [Westerdykella ornata]KAF2280766.1 cytochrome P450 [Westerdykella ornata]
MELPYIILFILPPLAFLYTLIRRWRFNRFRHLPQAYPNSLLFGHIYLFARGYKKFGDTRRHVDYILEDLVESAGRPDILVLDMRPLSYGMTVVTSHDVAEQISKATKMYPYSVTKSPTLRQYERLIGKQSLLVEEGESWKALRKRFNPGFAPSHLLSLLPQILSKTSIFVSKLDALSSSGQEFELDSLCTNITFDIIGKVVADLDFHAQGEDNAQRHEIVKYYNELGSTYSDTGRIPLWLNARKLVMRLWYSYLAERAIKQCIRSKFSETEEAENSTTKATRGPQDRSTTADQVRTFLFAGHDTTSILLQRLLYTLSIHPKCLAKIREEHEAVFGSEDPIDVFRKRPDEAIKALSYTSACIKEALRLWPPAGSARMSPPGRDLRVRLSTGEDVCVDGTILYLCPYLIQRDPKVYGETANDFVPERWLGDTDTSAEKKDEVGSQTGASKIPISAWRPFERGPRNCIGQELANLEARAILACVMRRYDFVKVGAGEVEVDEKGKPILDEKGRYRTKSELFNSQIVTAKPFDRCRMRVKRI